MFTEFLLCQILLGDEERAEGNVASPLTNASLVGEKDKTFWAVCAFSCPFSLYLLPFPFLNNYILKTVWGPEQGTYLQLGVGGVQMCLNRASKMQQSQNLPILGRNAAVIMKGTDMLGQYRAVSSMAGKTFTERLCGLVYQAWQVRGPRAGVGKASARGSNPA